LGFSPSLDYDFSAWVQLATAAEEIEVRLTCTFFDAVNCKGNAIGGPSTSTSMSGDTGATWVNLESTFTSPLGTLSALCTVEFATATGEAFMAGVDQVRLMANDEIFSDGFESGNTASWSVSVP
jgi:hypothetical protein